MEKKYPSSTKVVVVGGGVIGCSVAYHLTKFGWKDVVLLERDQLTSGTTWHAAGLVGQLGATATITKLRKYSLNLYKELEKKTELSTKKCKFQKTQLYAAARTQIACVLEAAKFQLVPRSVIFFFTFLRPTCRAWDLHSRRLRTPLPSPEGLSGVRIP